MERKKKREKRGVREGVAEEPPRVLRSLEGDKSGSYGS